MERTRGLDSISENPHQRTRSFSQRLDTRRQLHENNIEQEVSQPIESGIDFGSF